MVLRSKKFVVITAVAAGLVATMTATPILAHGFHRSAYRVGGYGPRIRYVHRSHGRGVALGSTRREIDGIYRRGYGGYLGGYYAGSYPYGGSLPDGYYRFPAGYSPTYRYLHPNAGYGLGDFGLGLLD